MYWRSPHLIKTMRTMFIMYVLMYLFNGSDKLTLLLTIAGGISYNNCPTHFTTTEPANKVQ